MNIVIWLNYIIPKVALPVLLVSFIARQYFEFSFYSNAKKAYLKYIPTEYDAEVAVSFRYDIDVLRKLLSEQPDDGAIRSAIAAHSNKIMSFKITIFVFCFLLAFSLIKILIASFVLGAK